MSIPQGQPATAAPSKKGGAKWLVFGASALALAAGGGVAFKKLGKQPDAAKEAVKKPVVLDPGVLELEPFVLNLADPAGDRYFRLNLRLLLDQKEIARRASGGLAQAKLRDRLLAVLAKKRASEVATVDGKERLRVELMAESEALLGEAPFWVAETDPAPAHVLEVLFTEFLVQ